MSVYISLHGRRVFHKRGCRYLAHISKDQIVSESRFRVERLGFTPCKSCIRAIQSTVQVDADILADYCAEHQMRYIQDNNLILINTDIGQWKLIRSTPLYHVYHGNKFPDTWNPILLESDMYHDQKDVTVAQRTSLSAILHYIYKHDSFRMKEVEQLYLLPRKTKAQKKRYNDLKARREIYYRCKAFQQLDKAKCITVNSL